MSSPSPSPRPAPCSAPAPGWTQRLVEQLQMLSEVTENLTYRLLELEERLGEGERELAQLRDSAPDSGELPEAVELWLQETEERLGRVEELLSQGGEPRQGGPRVVAAQRRRSDGHPPALEMLNGRSPTDQGDTPVPEEGEQALSR